VNDGSAAKRMKFADGTTSRQEACKWLLGCRYSRRGTTKDGLVRK
jgi:hypothetical protein